MTMLLIAVVILVLLELILLGAKFPRDSKYSSGTPFRRKHTRRVAHRPGVAERISTAPVKTAYGLRQREESIHETGFPVAV